MADDSPTKVLYLGMAGAFSLPPFEALLNAGIKVAAVLLPRPSQRERAGVRELRAPQPNPSSRLPLLTPYVHRNIVHLAWEHGIPVYEVGAFEDLEMRFDIIAVACFDRLIPRAVGAQAKLAVNVHPSLLPDNRGPAPLFWTFRLGEPTTGVTVHLLEDRADAGAIVAQQAVPVPPGIDGAELDRQLATLGAQLLIQVIDDFEKGRLQPQPQDEARATSHPWPTDEDWAIPADWSPERILHFSRGVAHMRPWSPGRPRE